MKCSHLLLIINVYYMGARKQRAAVIKNKKDLHLCKWALTKS